MPLMVLVHITTEAGHDNTKRRAAHEARARMNCSNQPPNHITRDGHSGHECLLLVGKECGEPLAFLPQAAGRSLAIAFALFLRRLTNPILGLPRLHQRSRLHSMYFSMLLPKRATSRPVSASFFRRCLLVQRRRRRPHRCRLRRWMRRRWKRRRRQNDLRLRHVGCASN